MTSYRADQVGEQVREEIMSIIRRDLKDPRIGFVSITAVRMSPDLRQARVRVSVLGNPEGEEGVARRPHLGQGPDSPRACKSASEPWFAGPAVRDHPLTERSVISQSCSKKAARDAG